MIPAGVGTPPLSELCPVGNGLQSSTVELHAREMGRTHGLGADCVDQLASVVTELADNIVKHARSGHIILRQVGEPTTGCVEVLALDKGSGIADMGRAMRDDGATSGARRRDAGLAGVKRVSTLFDVYSHPTRGTAVVVHVGPSSGETPTCCDAESMTHGRLGAVCVPLRGEEESGDGWAIETVDGRTVALLVDGLGHGPQAAIAARAAMAVFRDNTTVAPEIMMCTMHDALHATRGAAVSMMVADPVRRTVRFCGVGNVDGRIVTPDGGRHLLPQSGIVGHTMPRMQAVEMPWPADARLVLHSDGVSSRWNAGDYPGLLARHPAILAGVLFRDFGRVRDDATVLVLREVRPVLAA
jgi:anti-sigma regulatory factor (Ser/Thr protein kinase)